MILSHDLLAGLIEKKRLHLSLVIGTPRSGSTITTKAFGQLHDLWMDEPFKRKIGNVDPTAPTHGVFRDDLYESYCASLLNKIRPLLEEKEVVRLLIKDISGVMSEDLFSRWSELPSTFLVTLRAPNKQYVSYARAYYKRDIAGQPPYPSTTDFIASSLSMMEDYQLPRGGTVLGVNQKRWSSLQREVCQLRRRCIDRADTSVPSRLVFIDTTLMRFDPTQAWANVLRDLDFYEKGVDWLNTAWEVDSKSRHEGVSDAFQGRAFASSGIQPLTSGESVDLTSLPSRSRAHVEGLAPVYKEFLRAPENAYLPTIFEINNHACFGSSHKLAQVASFVDTAVREVHQGFGMTLQCG